MEKYLVMGIVRGENAWIMVLSLTELLISTSLICLWDFHNSSLLYPSHFRVPFRPEVAECVFTYPLNSVLLTSSQPLIFPHTFSRCGHNTWDLVRNTVFRPYPNSTESEPLKLGPSQICVNNPCPLSRRLPALH